MSIISILTLLVKALQYTPDAYSAVQKIVAVWEEQTGETITDEEWATIDDLLKSPSEYISDSES